MRIRHKPWARPELAASPFFIDDPAALKGGWHGAFTHPNNPVHLELGCGKGGFVAAMSVQNPAVNYIAVDIKSEMLGLAKRNVETAHAEAGTQPENVLFTAYDVERLNQIFDENDVADRIYINFCNPWSKPKQHKKRLTHTRQLASYKSFLRDGGELWFKTDSETLFLGTQRYIKEAGGFELRYLTNDLHLSRFEGSLPTEHEKMFTEMGIPIRFLIAVYHAPADENQPTL